MTDRFPDCDAKELQQLKESAENSNTKKSTKTCVTVWTTWAEEKGYSPDICSHKAKELDEMLQKFFAEVRKKDGSDYEPDSLWVMIASLDCHLKEMKALSHQQVSDLRGTSTVHWNQVLNQQNEDHSESDSSSNSNSELEVPASWDIQQECSNFMPGPASANHSESVRVHIRQLFVYQCAARTSDSSSCREGTMSKSPKLWPAQET